MSGECHDDLVELVLLLVLGGAGDLDVANEVGVGGGGDDGGAFGVLEDGEAGEELGDLLVLGGFGAVHLLDEYRLMINRFLTLLSTSFLTIQIVFCFYLLI